MAFSWRKIHWLVVSVVLVLVGTYGCNGTVWCNNRNKTIEKELEYADEPAGNPMKGFIGYYGAGTYSDFPMSMEYIAVPLSVLIVGEDKYDWTVLEGVLNELQSRGRHAILSFYVDYPGGDMGINAIPKYLLDSGIKTHYYETVYGNGYSLDYSDERIWDMAFDFVRAFAKEYDGDVRIAEIEASIVGLWGEWHTYPFKYNLVDEDLVKLALLYDDLFNETQIACRYPIKEMGTDIKVGFSDYSFCYSSIVLPWSQWNLLTQANLTRYWEHSMGGGELYPAYVASIFKTPNWQIDKGESFAECIEALHPTWLLIGNVVSYSGKERESAIEASNMLGYSFTATRVIYTPVISDSASELTVSLGIKNIGIAPFYYPWKVNVGILSGGKVVESLETGWDITKIAADGKEYLFDSVFDGLVLEEGTYQLGVKIVNPLVAGKSIRFANAEQRDDGWLILGDLQVADQATPSEATPPEATKSEAVKKESYDEYEHYPAVRDEYGVDVSFVELKGLWSMKEKVVRLGIRIRDYGIKLSLGNISPKILLYQDDQLVKKYNTTWNLKQVPIGGNKYYNWSFSMPEEGIYYVKLQITPDTEPIALGWVLIVNDSDLSKVDKSIVPN